MASQKPTILFLGTQMEVAGAQRVMLSQAGYFHARGYAVQAVFFYDKQNLSDEWQAEHPFPVVSLRGWKHNGFLFTNIARVSVAIFRLFALLRKMDVVVTYTPHSNILGLPVAWLAGVTVRLGTHHGHIENAGAWLHRLHGRLTNSIVCTRMICVSNQVRSLAMREEHARPDKLVVIDNGIHPPQAALLSASEREQLRALIDVAPADILFITVGRLMVQKGHTYLLDAIQQLPRQGLVFAFVGQGPLRDALEAKARALGIAEQVRFTGVREDVAQLLQTADVFVQPSLWEGMSLALLEAMFAGLPIVATGIEAATDVLEHERTGLLVTPQDPASLASALQRLANDTALRRTLGDSARQEAQQHYTVDVMGAAYAELIEDLWHE